MSRPFVPAAFRSLRYGVHILYRIPCSTATAFNDFHGKMEAFASGNSRYCRNMAFSELLHRTSNGKTAKKNGAARSRSARSRDAYSSLSSAEDHLGKAMRVRSLDPDEAALGSLFIRRLCCRRRRTSSARLATPALRSCYRGSRRSPIASLTRCACRCQAFSLRFSHAMHFPHAAPMRQLYPSTSPRFLRAFPASPYPSARACTPRLAE